MAVLALHADLTLDRLLAAGPTKDYASLTGGTRLDLTGSARSGPELRHATETPHP